jgi:hypothetical protein
LTLARLARLPWLAWLPWLAGLGSSHLAGPIPAHHPWTTTRSHLLAAG